MSRTAPGDSLPIVTGSLKGRLVAVAATAGLVAAVVQVVPAAALAASASGQLVAVSAARIMNTTDGTGTTLAPFAAGETRQLTVVGVGGVPSTGVLAVAIDVTTTHTTGAVGTVSVWPAGQPQPLATTLTTSLTGAADNTVMAQVGVGGQVNISLSGGSSDILVDVEGYVTSDGSGAAGTLYTPVTQTRILDTRSGLGGFTGPLGAAGTVSFAATGVGGVPAGATSVALNITGVTPTASTYLIPFAFGAPRPTAGSVNVVTGAVSGQMMIVPVGTGGKVSIYNSVGSIQILADVEGYFTTNASGGSFYVPITQNRIMDTRSGLGGSTTLQAARSVPLTISGTPGVPAAGVTAAAVTLTAVGASSASWLELYPDGTTRPSPAASLNYPVSVAVSNMVIVPVASDGKIQVYNAGGTVNAIVDVLGYFTAAGVPSAPLTVSATPGDAKATVAWAAPLSSNGSPISAYTVTSSPGALTATTTGATSATVSGLTDGTSYTFTVTATNASGTGPASAASSAITASAAMTLLTLTASSDVLSAGQSATLTATSDVDPVLVGRHVIIRNTTTGAIVKDCSSGVACVTTATQASGAPQVYQAFGYPLNVDWGSDVVPSGDVSVERAPWSVLVSSTSTSVGPGESITVTATANQDVGATGGSYVLRLVDETSHTDLGSCTSGTACSKQYSYSTGALHVIVGVVSTATGTDVQATSQPLALAVRSWAVTATSSLSGGTLTVSAATTRTLGVDGSSLVLIDQGTQTQVGSACTSGTTCTWTMTAPGTTHSYAAQVTGSGLSTAPVSGVVSSDPTAYWVKLTASTDVISTTGTSVVTATVNQVPTGPYHLLMWETTLGTGVTDCGQVATCTVNVGWLNSVGVGPDVRSMRAVVAQFNGSGNQPSAIQATSNAISVAPQAWTVTLSSSRASSTADGQIVFSAVMNQDLSGTTGAYQLDFRDLGATGQASVAVSSCSTGSTCTITLQSGMSGWNITDAPHRYIAYVEPYQHVGDGRGTPLLATSNQVSITRRPWTVYMPISFGRYLHVTTNQGSYATNSDYEIELRRRDSNPPGGGTMPLATMMMTPGVHSYQFDLQNSSTTTPYILGGSADLVAVISWNTYTHAGKSSPEYAADSDGYSAPTGSPLAGVTGLETNPGGLPAGEFTQTTTDLTLPGRLPVSLTRTYSSKRVGTRGMFGYGWATPWDMRVEKTDPNTGIAVPGVPGWGDPLVALVNENGFISYFDYAGDAYTARSPEHASLFLAASGGWSLKRSDGTGLTYTFDSSTGLLSKITDRNGEQVTVTRTSTSIVIAPQDGSSRQITLTVNPATGEVSQASGPQGRSVQYTVTGDNLTQVTDARGKVWTYGYTTPANHLVTSTQSPVQAAQNPPVSVGYAYDPTSHFVTQMTTPINATSGQTTPSVGTTTVTTTFWNTGDYLDFKSEVVQNSGTTTPITEDYYYVSGVLVQEIRDPGLTGTNLPTSYTYNSADQLIRTLDPTGVSSSTSYDSFGNKVSQTSSAGDVTSWTYDANTFEPLSKTTTDENGSHTSTYLYDSLGNLAKVTTPLDASDNSVTEYFHEFTHTGDVSRVRVWPTATTSFDTLLTYSPEGFLQSSTAPDGGKTTWVHNAYGDVTSTVSPRGNCTGPDCGTALAYTTSTTYWPGSSLPDVVTDPQGSTLTYGYDGDGHRTTVTDAYGKVWTTAYWLDGTLRQTTNPTTGSVTTDVDGADRTIQTTTAMDTNVTAVTTTTYTAGTGFKHTMVSAEGNKSGQTGAWILAHTATYTFDAAGRLTTTSIPDPNNTQQTISWGTHYDYAGRPDQSTTPGTTIGVNRTTATSYGAQDRVAHTIDNTQASTDSSYDFAGRLTKVVYPSNGTFRPVTSYLYDDAGHLLETDVQKDATVLATKTTFDSVGRPVTSVSPRGTCSGCNPANFTTTTTYYPDGTIKSVVNPLGQATAYAYYSNGLTQSVTDPNGVVHGYTYDSANRLKTATVPGSTAGTVTTTYSYFDDGTIKNVQTPLSATGWSSTYFSNGQVKTTTDPMGNTDSYAYNLDGAMTSHVTARGGAAGTITYTPDALDRTTTTSYGDTTPTVSVVYNQDGTRASMTDAVTGPVSYGYDLDGRLASLTRGTAVWAYTYTTNGLPASTTRPDGTTETFGYDQANRPTTVNTATGSYSYQWDPNSNLSTTTNPNGTVETQTWDQADRLLTDTTTTSATTDVAMSVDSRDASGNPTKVTVTRGTSTEYRTFVDDLTGRLQGVCYNVPLASCTETTATQWWTFDGDGNRTAEKNGTGTGTTTAFTFNAADQPLTFKVGVGATKNYTLDADGNVTGDGNGNTYTYDLNNQIRTSVAGGTTWAWTRDGDGNLVQQKAGGTSYTYNWNLNTAVPQLASVTSSGVPTTYRYDPLGRLAAVNSPAYIESVAHDWIGGPSDLLSNAGTIVRSIDQTPDGTSRPAIGAPTTPSGPISDIGFQGMLQSRIQGLYSTPARTYDPTAGRFTSQDPQFMSSGSAWDSAYTLDANNTTAHTDPSGQSITDVWNFAVGAAEQAIQMAATNTRLLAGDPNAWGDTKANVQQSIQANGLYAGLIMSFDPVYTVLSAGSTTINDIHQGNWNAAGHDAFTTTQALAATIGIATGVESLAGAAVNTIRAAPTITELAAESAPVWDQMPLFVDTPHGLAMQADDAASLALRDQVLRGGSVFKGGNASSLPASESQFFAAESPTSAGYAARYGIPEKNLPFDWISEGTIRPGAPFITRPAPGVGSNLGGGREVVTDPGSFLAGN